MKARNFSLALACIVFTGAASAGPRTVTLDVQNMTCSLCPLTVKKALEHVPGVRQVSVDYASKTATVQFDDDTTEVDSLTVATTAAGYPSTLKPESR